MTDWNDIASTAIVVTAGQPPPAAEISFAMVQGAVYDAVNAIDRGHRPYLVQPAARPTDSKEAAAATAAFRVLDGLFSATQHATLQARYDASLAAIAGPGGKAAASPSASKPRPRCSPPARGRRPQQPVHSRLRHDARRLPADAAAVRAGPRAVGRQRPAVRRAQRRTAPHPSAERAHEPGLCPRLQRDQERRCASQHHPHRRSDGRRDLLAGARIRAVEPRLPHDRDGPRTIDRRQRADVRDGGPRGADGAIGCWDNKYRWNTWRPITAVREAASDGNPLTVADTGWTPLFDPITPVAAGQAPLVTPPFPEYPSGHNCAAGSILGTLFGFFGTDRVAFSLHSNKSGTTRSWDRLSDVLRESINARIWAGIHFRNADVEGALLGAKVAVYLHLHDFQPVSRQKDVAPSMPANRRYVNLERENGRHPDDQVVGSEQGLLFRRTVITLTDMTTPSRRQWTDETIRVELLPIAEELGRMPKKTELTERGIGGLWAAMGRRGGVDAWREIVAAHSPARPDARGRDGRAGVRQPIEEQIAIAAYFLFQNGHPGRSGDALADRRASARRRLVP